MAYIMGHQSTQTLENYGYRQAGKTGGLRIKPAVGFDEITSLVRDAHSKREQAMKKRIKK